MNESSIHLSMGESAAEMTLSHIEVLQSSLLGERQDRLALQGRVNELEGTISLLTKQFRHTSIERDVEKARTSLFSDAHADVRSPSLVARTVAALVDYPNVSVCCLLRAGDQWAVVSERSDDHVFLSCALWEGVVRVLELDVVMLDRVAALPADVVAAVNAACQRRLDAYSLRDNLVLTAVHRDCVWLLLSDSSLQALPDSLVGWTALLATATRLVADAFRRQQEDLDREESALVKRVADRVFALLFGAGISTRDDARLALTGVVEASNAILPSCANEVFVVDSNFVGLDSRLELSTIAEGGVLAEAIVSGRLTMCRDPNNSKRDLKLDCGGVVLPLPVVAAVPLWLGAECSGYLVLRLFEPAGRDMVVRRAEQLAAAIGYLSILVRCLTPDSLYVEGCCSCGPSRTLRSYSETAQTYPLSCRRALSRWTATSSETSSRAARTASRQRTSSRPSPPRSSARGCSFSRGGPTSQPRTGFRLLSTTMEGSDGGLCWVIFDPRSEVSSAAYLA